jgi:hypothetical protein
MPAAYRWYPAFLRNLPTAVANHPYRPAFPALPVAAQDGLAEQVKPVLKPLAAALVQPPALAQVREPVRQPQAQSQGLAEPRVQQ